jgi:hypothetical protein
VNETELRDELRRELHRVPAWRLEPDGVARAATGIRRRRHLVTGLTVVVALGVTAGSVIGLARLGNGSGAPGPAATGPKSSGIRSPAPTRPEPGPKNGAALSCTSDGIQPSEATLEPGRAGVRIVVDNTTGSQVGFTYPNGGSGVAPGVHAVEYPAGGTAWPLAPGDYTMKCVPDSVSDPDMIEGATLHVVDPNRLWVSSDLECRSDEGFGGIGDFVPGAGMSLEQAVHKALDGYASPGDVIERVGYPDAPLPQFVLVRSGRSIVVATIRPAGAGRWLPDEVSGCADEARTKGGFQAPIRDR